LLTKRIKGLIFDLDGVLTQTQEVHKSAWKLLFDEYLLTVDDKKFDTTSMTDMDYKIYIDGKPRYEGIRSFLKSRNIELPYGDKKDPSDKLTICGLGNRKNQIFNEMIEKNGVETYRNAVKKLKQWRDLGLKTAIVSSSKNCEKIIKRVGIDKLFDVRIDGVVAEQRHLKGKPNPDIFIEAAKYLNISPENGVVFEDAISGVEAGQRGHFGLVVGVNRFNNGDALLANGADIIINNFADLDLFDNPMIAEYFDIPKPLIFTQKTDIFKSISASKPVFFLDYDGTLTPIVSRPEDAKISPEMKQTLKELADNFTVAIITGRDTKDIQNLVQLDNLIYAGSHGYDIIGPDGMKKEHEKAGEIVQLLDKIEQELVDRFKDKTEGVQVERKRYAIANHYRNARESDIPYIYEVVDKIIKNNKGLKKGEGKKVVEIKPDLDWHKGKAVFWILEELGLDDSSKYLPIFIGDDITDEDAFKALKDKGIGIMVGSHGQETAANYSLKNVFQVKEFFEKIVEIHKNKKGNE